ncbi:S1 family peptidase [Streptomyces sp. HMX112]|uniref:S1 family peptidase n=1 Tax=Streptomyces sp. HMX112 TaxID=3390850 RepID=UPI003A80C237
MQPSTPFRRATALLATALAVLATTALAPQPAGASTGAVSRAPSASAPRAVQPPDPLTSTMAKLNASEEIPGTAWGVDPVLDRVVVTADRTVTGTKLYKLIRILQPLGNTVALKRTATELRTLIQGSDAIYGRDYSARCSLGFNVRRQGAPDGFLTAGHCGNVVTSWAETAGGPEIARTVDSSFPTNDYALAEYTADVPRPSSVNLYEHGSLPITGARDAVVGDRIGRSGSTTHARFGTVTAVNQTVTYPEGRVTGLIRTDACAEPGDSGGPLFTYDPDNPPESSTALGLLSGGDGDCQSGGNTFYQPVTEPLGVYGATIG